MDFYASSATLCASHYHWKKASRHSSYEREGKYLGERAYGTGLESSFTSPGTVMDYQRSFYTFNLHPLHLCHFFSPWKMTGLYLAGWVCE